MKTAFDKPDKVILTMPIRTMPLQIILATPYIRFIKTIKSGQSIRYVDLRQQELKLDLAMKDILPDDVRPTLTVKKT